MTQLIIDFSIVREKNSGKSRKNAKNINAGKLNQSVNKKINQKSIFL